MAYAETHPVTIWRRKQALEWADLGYLAGTQLHADEAQREYERLVAEDVIPDAGSAGA